MMTLIGTSLRSKVARRILSVFLLCALIPFAGLVIVSYHQVSEFFNENTRRQLRAMAKTFGMDVYERLLMNEASLGVISSKIDAYKNIASEEALDFLPDRPKERWKALAVITADGQRHRLLGDVETFPELTLAEKESIASGKALIMIRPSASHSPPRIFMSVIDDPRRTDYSILIGEIKETYLWGIGNSRILPPYIKPCIIGPSGVALRCVHLDSNTLPDDLVRRIAHTDVGDFQWSREGKDYQASYWTISNKFEFQSASWIVILRTSREGIFESIAKVKNTFLLWIVVCIGSSVLLAIYQFRKRLIPVERLQEGTRRIAEKDFNFRVKVTSGDEFQQLAVSMNAMAAQLGQQFNMISTTHEIDRAVLSLLDTSKIVEVILTRIMRFTRCDLGTLTLFKSDRDQVQQWLALREHDVEAESSGDHARRDGDAGAALDHADSNQLFQEIWPLDSARAKNPLAHEVAAAKSIIVASDIESYSQLSESAFLRQHGISSCFGTPLIVKDDVLGVIAFYSKEARAFSVEEIDFVNGLTGQAAIAIYNSQLYERAKQQAIELEKSNKVKDEFLGVISHELRTPVNVILGYLRMVQEKILGEINPDQAKALETVAKHSNELLTTIESIMEATKIETGAVVTENRPVNLFAFMENLKSQCAIPPDKELTVDWQYPADPPPLFTDEASLRRILQNLISNAIKFTDKGRVAIAARHIPERQSVEFTVSDTGIGIPADSLPLIFELFRQQDSSTTREHGGLGLGLYLVKKLTERIGGTVSVESKVGSGSVFTVTVPLLRDENVAIAA